MKHITTTIKKLTNALLLGSMMILNGCSSIQAATEPASASVLKAEAEGTVDNGYFAITDANSAPNTATAADTAAYPISNNIEEADQSDDIDNDISTATTSPLQQTIPWTAFFSSEDIPEWTGEPYVVINDNKPFFPEDYCPDCSFETYSELDELGRCQSVCANIGIDLMPTGERTSISEVTPSGWHQREYDKDLVPGGWLYNRGHLIGFQLTAEGANPRNLITATKYLNNTGMLPFENMVADYVKESDNKHVLYRVTPIYTGNDLVAKGVLLEAKSTEDNGESILFNVFCFNKQPGITIDYASGESWATNSEDELTITEDTEKENTETFTDSSPVTNEPDNYADNQTEDGQVGNSQIETTANTADTTSAAAASTYVLNTSTHKIHDPDCGSVSTMINANKEYTDSTLEELQEDGYTLCSRCLGN